MSRRPKPSHLKVVAGTDRPDRTNPAEPTPDVGVPECPSWVKGKARTAWKEIGSTLVSMGVLTVADGKALELLVEAYAEFRAADERVKEEGLTYETVSSTGGRMVRANPAVGIRADAWRRVRLQLIEFGLTPASRSKVSAAEQSALDREIARLFEKEN